MLAQISYGEAADKITILTIKSERINDPAKLVNIRRELELLSGAFFAEIARTPAFDTLFAKLKAINETLWEIEDEIRELEAKQDFGARFIALARSVYHTNDKRAAVKNRINQAFGSAIVEEKSYKGG